MQTMPISFRIKKPALKALLKLYLLFGLALLVFFVIFNHPAGRMYIVQPFTGLVTNACGLLMSLFGADATTTGGYLSTASYSINVVDGCNGIYATAILVSAMIAYPAPWLSKAWGIPLGIMAVFAMNLVRVISLFYLGQSYPDFFREVHVYVWQPIIILWAIVVWDYWTRQVTKMEKAKAPALSH